MVDGSFMKNLNNGFVDGGLDRDDAASGRVVLDDFLLLCEYIHGSSSFSLFFLLSLKAKMKAYYETRHNCFQVWSKVEQVFTNI